MSKKTINKIMGWLSHIKSWLLRINRKLGGRVITMLSIALALALVTVIFTDTWIASIESHDEKIIEIRHNIDALESIRADILEAESAQRGFILTQHDAYIAPFDKAMLDARANLKLINGLVTKDATPIPRKQEQDWVLALSTRFEVRVSEFQLTTLLVTEGMVKEARQIVDTKKGLVDMDKIMNPIKEMVETQNKAVLLLRSMRSSTIGLARISVYGSALVLTLLVIMVIRQLLVEMATRDQLRAQLNIELKNYETQLEERTKLLKALALDAQSDIERERQKLARELHDELGAILTATKMDISWVIRKSKAIIPEVGEKLSKTIRYLDQGIQFKREVVQNLRPSMIETFGFWPALRSLIDDMAARNQWGMDVILPDETTQISETVSLIVYRVIQETLNNAAKYAQASKISIHMIVDLGYLKMEIEDNGVGLDMNKISDTTHGLKGMKNRVMAIGGQLELVSSPGQGLISRVMIPISTAQTQA